MMRCDYVRIVPFARLDEEGRLDKYFFFYNLREPEKVFDVFERFADNPELNFNRSNAKVLTEKVQEQVKQTL